MSEVTVHFEVSFTLTPQEFTLIGRALCGVISGTSERRRAAALSARLASQMEQRCRERLDLAEGASARAAEILADFPQPSPDEDGA